MIHGNPFDRLGRDARDRAEIVTDRHRSSGSTSRSAMRPDIVLIGMTEKEAERHVDLVLSTTIRSTSRMRAGASERTPQGGKDLKTTSIDDLIAKLEKLSAAGYGDETVSLPVIGPKRTSIAAMLGRAEDVNAKNARQIECSITVWDAVDLLETTKPDTPVYLTLDDGRSVAVDGRDYSFTRDESGHYWALHPASAKNGGGMTAARLADQLSSVLRHEELEDRREIRLVVKRRSGPASDRMLALRVDGIVDPHAAGADGVGPFMLNAVTIPAE